MKIPQNDDREEEEGRQAMNDENVSLEITHVIVMPSLKV